MLRPSGVTWSASRQTSLRLLLDEIANVEPAERDGQREDEDRHRRSPAEVETGHSRLVDVGAEQVVVGGLGTGILQQSDLCEHPQIPDQVEQQDDRDDRSEHREDDEPEARPRAGTVELTGLEYLAAHLGEAGVRREGDEG